MSAEPIMRHDGWIVRNVATDGILFSHWDKDRCDETAARFHSYGNWNVAVEECFAVDREANLSRLLRGMAGRLSTQRRLANNWRIIASANRIAAVEASSFANRLVLEKDQWRDSAGTVETQVRKLRAALKEIADGGCLCCGESKQFPICTVSFPSTRSEWCEPCIAREALAEATP